MVMKDFDTLKTVATEEVGHAHCFFYKLNTVLYNVACGLVKTKYYILVLLLMPSVLLCLQG